MIRLRKINIHLGENMYELASVIDIPRLAANIAKNTLERTIGNTITAFTNGVQNGIAAVDNAVNSSEIGRS